MSLITRFDEEQSLIARLQRQLKEQCTKIEDLDETLNEERQFRVKAEKARYELQNEVNLIKCFTVKKNTRGHIDKE